MAAAKPATSTDPAALFTVITALAATFVAVGLYLLFKLTDCLTRLFVSRTKRRIARSRRFLALPYLGRLVYAIDVASVIGLRSAVALYAGFVLLFVTPILLTVGSLDLASAMVVVPGH